MATTRINQVLKPKLSDFEKAEIIFATFSNYEDEAKLTWLIPQQYKKYADGLFEIVGQLEVIKEYDPNSSTPKATYSSGWHLLIEIAEKQFEYEKVNGKSQNRLTVFELTKDKPLWKFW